MTDTALATLQEITEEIQTRLPTDARVFEFVQAASLALKQTTNPVQVKKINDYTKATRELCKQEHIRASQINALTILLARTRSKLGQLLIEYCVDGRPPKDRASRGLFTLQDINLSPYVARDCRKLAQINEWDKWQVMAEKFNDGLISIAGILRMAGIGRGDGGDRDEFQAWLAAGRRLKRDGKFLAASVTLLDRTVVEI